jgi:mRNA-degrading endonuclease toxin of MazEF toxin-antitoxin module
MRRTKRPKRGDIFRVKLYGLVGTELYGKGPEQERACVIVSSDSFSFGTDEQGIFPVSPRLTVAPLTSHKGMREDVRPLWGIPIQLSDGIERESDIDIDPDNIDYPEEEQLQIWLKDERSGRNKGNWVFYPNGLKMPFKSIIDCSVLYTVNSFNPEEWPDLDPDIYDVDVDWERRYGELKELATLCVDAALQMLIDGGIRYKADLRFKAGDVIIANLLGPDRESSRQQCLVISSPGIDAIRERMLVYGGKKRLEQFTVVPLEPITEPEDHTNIRVNVSAIGKREAPRQFIANCRAIQTIDWSSRRAVYPPEGQVDDTDMAKVRKALRIYLDLPQ